MVVVVVVGVNSSSLPPLYVAGWRGRRDRKQIRPAEKFNFNHRGQRQYRRGGRAFALIPLRNLQNGEV